MIIILNPKNTGQKNWYWSVMFCGFLQIFFSSMQEEKIDRVGTLIGTGLSGQVFLSLQKEMLLVEKRIKSKSSYQREYKFLALLTQNKVPNVIHLLDTSISTEERKILTLPYYQQGDLDDHLLWQRYLPLRKCRNFFHILLTTLHQLVYQYGIIHSDLKPSNLLLTDDLNQIILTDFGLSLWVHDVETKIDEESLEIGGSLAYSSPEAIWRHCRTKDDFFRSDVYSAVLVFCATLYGEIPFMNLKKEKNLVSGFTRDKYRQDLQNYLRDSGIIYKTRLTKIKKQKKISEIEYKALLVAHDHAQDIIQHSLCWDSKDRLSYDTMLKHPFFKECHQNSSGGKKDSKYGSSTKSAMNRFQKWIQLLVKRK